MQKFFAFLEREIDRASLLNDEESGRDAGKAAQTLISDWGISQTSSFPHNVAY